jgi:ribosomal protein S18 acetylase RimI-like enzyme
MVRAFWDYPETVHLLPGERRRRHVLPRYLLSDARDALRFDLLLGAESNGAIAGAAAWIPPEAYPVSFRRQVRQVVDLAPAFPWGWRALREARRGQAANRAMHREHPPHFYLRAIGVDPQAQSRGVGTSLVAPVLKIADDRGVGCFLQTATPDNVGWYERFGFRVVSRYRPTPAWPDVWAMWRDVTAPDG